MKLKDGSLTIKGLENNPFLEKEIKSKVEDFCNSKITITDLILFFKKINKENIKLKKDFFEDIFLFLNNEIGISRNKFFQEYYSVFK